MLLLGRDEDRRPFLDGDVGALAPHRAAPREDEDLVLPRVRVERRRAARLELEEPHREGRRAVLLRDEPADARPAGAAGAHGLRGNLIGSHDFPQCELFFEEVRIPGDYLLIGPEIYESAIDNFLNLGGLSVAVVFTGLARAAFEEALTYAQQRVQGGKLLAEHQIIQSKLFEMFVKVEAARALSRAAFTYCMTTPNPIPVEYSTAAKVYCTQVAYEVAHEAVQIHGAYGLSPEFLVSKLFRDARGAIIGDGCNEVLGLKRIYNVYENYKP